MVLIARLKEQVRQLNRNIKKWPSQQNLLHVHIELLEDLEGNRQTLICSVTNEISTDKQQEITTKFTILAENYTLQINHISDKIKGYFEAIDEIQFTIDENIREIKETIFLLLL